MAQMKKASIILALLILTGCAGWSKADKALLAASWVASGADYATTIRILDNGGYELNPVYGEHPSNTELATYMLSSQIIAIGLAHFIPKYRKVFLGGKMIANTGCAIHNSQVD